MFTHIETLIALSAAGSMTRAATHLRVTQSTVSKRLAALEREVGRLRVHSRFLGIKSPGQSTAGDPRSATRHQRPPQSRDHRTRPCRRIRAGHRRWRQRRGPRFAGRSLARRNDGIGPIRPKTITPHRRCDHTGTHDRTQLSDLGPVAKPLATTEQTMVFYHRSQPHPTVFYQHCTNGT